MKIRLVMAVLLGWALLAVVAARADSPHDHSTTASAPATTTAPPTVVDVALTAGEEDHQKILRATVTLAGKPVENARVGFYVKRTFGNLPVGEDVTLDDGTAAVPYPVGLKGGSTGTLEFFAEIKAPLRLAGKGQITSPGEVVVEPQDPFPRALWAPRAPYSVLGTILALLTGVWCTYGFIVHQLFRIRKEGVRK